MTPQDESDMHQRFRRLVAAVVASRRRFAPEIAARDWVVKCYDSRLEFESLFPTVEQQEEAVGRLESQINGLFDQLQARIERANRTGPSSEARNALAPEFEDDERFETGW